MIDWGEVATNSTWLLGLALILAAASWADTLRIAAGQPPRSVWRALQASGWARLGGLLFCAGLAATSRSWLEGAGWAALGLYLLFLAWRGPHRRRTPDPAAPTDVLASAAATPGPVHRASPLRRAAAWLVSTELLWLALLAPFFLFPAPGRGLLALLAVPLLWLARRLARGHFVPRTLLDWPILLLLVMLLVSLYATFDLGYSLPKVAGVLYGVALYYALVDWMGHGRRVGWATAGYLLAGGGLLLVALLGVQWNDKFPLLGRIAAQLPAAIRGLPGAENGIHPSEVGGALLWLVPLQGALALWAWRGGLRVPTCRWLLRSGLPLLGAVSTSVLLLTQSRAAVAGLAIGGLALIWLLIPPGRLLIALLAAAGLATAVYLGPATLVDRFAAAVGPGTGTVLNLGSIDGRAEIWSRALYGIEDFAFTGMGMGTFRRVLPVLYPTAAFSPDRDLGHAHNQFLQTALDLGLPGLVAYLAIWLLTAALLVAAWRRTADPWLRALAAGVGTGLLAYFVYALTDTVALGAKPGVFFWALLALAVGVWQATQRPAPLPATPSGSALPLDQDPRAVEFMIAAAPPVLVPADCAAGLESVQARFVPDHLQSCVETFPARWAGDPVSAGLSSTARWQL